MVRGEDVRTKILETDFQQVHKLEHVDGILIVAAAGCPGNISAPSFLDGGAFAFWWTASTLLRHSWNDF